jgi:hypothetical protein
MKIFDWFCDNIFDLKMVMGGCIMIFLNYTILFATIGILLYIIIHSVKIYEHF